MESVAELEPGADAESVAELEPGTATYPEDGDVAPDDASLGDTAGLLPCAPWSSSRGRGEAEAAPSGAGFLRGAVCSSREPVPSAEEIERSWIPVPSAEETERSWISVPSVRLFSAGIMVRSAAAHT